MLSIPIHLQYVFTDTDHPELCLLDDAEDISPSPEIYRAMQRCAAERARPEDVLEVERFLEVAKDHLADETVPLHPYDMGSKRSDYSIDFSHDDQISNTLSRDSIQAEAVISREEPSDEARTPTIARRSSISRRDRQTPTSWSWTYGEIVIGFAGLALGGVAVLSLARAYRR